MRRLFLLLALLPTLAWAGDIDDFGTWLELGAEKALPRNMEIGLGAGLRTHSNSSLMDRWDVGASFGYKAHKYLKLSAGYNYIHDYNPDEKEWSESCQFNSDGTRVETFKMRIYKAHQSSRHRFYLDASSSVKLWKWLRISGRLRYQNTYSPAKTLERYRYEEKTEYTQKFTGEFDSNGNPVFHYEKEDPEIKHDEWDLKEKESKTRQVLRSRIKLELDKKHLDWKPFVSMEFHNNVATGEHMHFDKFRTAIGTDYKISKQHSVGLSYVFTLDRMYDPFPNNMHALSASYSFDF